MSWYYQFVIWCMRLPPTRITFHFLSVVFLFLSLSHLKCCNLFFLTRIQNKNKCIFSIPATLKLHRIFVCLYVCMYVCVCVFLYSHVF